MLRLILLGMLLLLNLLNHRRRKFRLLCRPCHLPLPRRHLWNQKEKSQTSDMDSSLGLPSPSPMREYIQVLPAPSQQEQEIRIYHDAPDPPSLSSVSPQPEDLSPSEPMSPPHKPLPSPTDSALLDALLTTLIFAEVKPTPLPRLVADLAHRMSNVQPDRIKSILTATPCVGIVHRSGKDAAGKELSDEYYYIAESCPALMIC